MRNLIQKIVIPVIGVLALIGVYNVKSASADEQDVREVIENSNVPQPVKDAYLWELSWHNQFKEKNTPTNDIPKPYSTGIIGEIPITESTEDTPVTPYNNKIEPPYIEGTPEEVTFIVPPRTQRESRALEKTPKLYEGNPKQDFSLPSQKRKYGTPKNNLELITSPEVLDNIYEKKAEGQL